MKASQKACPSLSKRKAIISLSIIGSSPLDREKPFYFKWAPWRIRLSYSMLVPPNWILSVKKQFYFMVLPFLLDKQDFRGKTWDLERIYANFVTNAQPTTLMEVSILLYNIVFFSGRRIVKLSQEHKKCDICECSDYWQKRASDNHVMWITQWHLSDDFKINCDCNFESIVGGSLKRSSGK